MKKVLFIALLIIGSTLVPHRASAQLEAIQEAIKEAIMAIDLGVQKVQTQTVALQSAQKELENIMQQTHLTDITSWVQKQKDLYNEYYQELWQIKTAITYYQRIKDIISKQIQLVNDYKNAYAQVQQDPHFSAAELSHILSVYKGIFTESVNNINQITMVINAFTTQMDDASRLRIINTASDRIDKNYNDLRVFTQQNVLLSLQRSKDDADINVVKNIYGLQ